MFDIGSIPWDHSVEMFEAGPGMIVNRRAMRLREALEYFRNLPVDARWGYGVGMHEMFMTTLNGRPVAVGFLNASTLQKLVPLLPCN
ncbi:hypothetical protein [Sphingomonas oryzagri]|uniref:Uncharacterized protein n=1 Tax=Sphingomonas oryzagri TaxID=3042314 RepID=A0ABT6N1S1_9SPHN|nr:hypothetical protein [Sphingomonas oryzagri]MDH7639224.1 hypothetical protein [Sphingomonas oryzagri]